MNLTAVFEPAKEGGYTCFVEEIPTLIFSVKSKLKASQWSGEASVDTSRARGARSGGRAGAWDVRGEGWEHASGAT